MNRRHTDFQSVALPTELPDRCPGDGRLTRLSGSENLAREPASESPVARCSATDESFADKPNYDSPPCPSTPPPMLLHKHLGRRSVVAKTSTNPPPASLRWGRTRTEKSNAAAAALGATDAGRIRYTARMPARQYHSGIRISAIGLLLNAALGTVKLVAGLLGRSTALVADAVESLTDIFGSLIVWRGLQIASRPADEDHPYGHGKAESLAALIVALMLISAAMGISAEAIRGLLSPPTMPAGFTLWVLLIVIVAKEVMFRITRRAADTTRSTALVADAWHHRSDALTSVAAAIGIALARYGGSAFASADDWAALVAAGVILYNAQRILRPPVHELMDREEPHLIERLRKVAVDVPGVANIEKVYARKSGLRYWVDMHVEVDPNMAVREAHELAHSVKDLVRLALPEVQDVLVHVEPHNPAHTADHPNHSTPASA